MDKADGDCKVSAGGGKDSPPGVGGDTGDGEGRGATSDESPSSETPASGGDFTCTPDQKATNGECCDGKDNNGNGRVDEGEVCADVAEPCPPGAFKACDCYCGVHRKCNKDGTWGPCLVDETCTPAKVTTQEACKPLGYCDFGECVPDFGFTGGSDCVHHSDCKEGQICDLGDCLPDPYTPGVCGGGGGWW